MQWLLQDFEDTQKLAEALDRLGIEYSWHKIIPFVGEFTPEPTIVDPQDTVCFGSYAVWRTCEAWGLWPGVFRIAPFLEQSVWHPYLLNGADALVLPLTEVPETVVANDRAWFIRPVEDSKEIAGTVKSGAEIVALAKQVLALGEDEIPNGSLRHDTRMMLALPVRIQKEWRLWAVDGKIVTYSLYKEGHRVTYRHEIDEDALAFAKQMVALHPSYARAYVLDICRTDDGLRLLETNCLNAAGFYDADLVALAAAIDGMQRPSSSNS